MTAVNLQKKKSDLRAIFGYSMTAVSAACLLATVIPLFAVLIFVAIQGFRSINLNLFSNSLRLPVWPVVG
ncbi:hypothetical protein NON20_01315 [Synechocystis sp. B12]|nr:hypothetical protein NON20_01315 [Synechocystis sp. B12]